MSVFWFEFTITYSTVRLYCYILLLYVRLYGSAVIGSPVYR